MKERSNIVVTSLLRVMSFWQKTFSHGPSNQTQRSTDDIFESTFLKFTLFLIFLIMNPMLSLIQVDHKKNITWLTNLLTTKYITRTLLLGKNISSAALFLKMSSAMYTYIRPCLVFFCWVILWLATMSVALLPSAGLSHAPYILALPWHVWKLKRQKCS